MEIKILTVGKIKEDYLVQGIKEYTKRISKYSKIDIVEVMDEKTEENVSFNQIEIVKQKEAERLKKYITKDYYVITLEIAGKMLSSTDLASHIVKVNTYHSSKIMFIIGGSLGLAKEITDQADYYLSFSKMTFPHQLMRLILVEQIYRAFRINNNEPYHK